MVDDYGPGDICITNDPYSGFVCTHSPDLHMWKPIFHQGEIVGFAVGHIHNTDVGGAVPASLSRQLTEVHQEGIRIPPMKLYGQGELNQALLDIMLPNVRMPEQNCGDLKAQIAAMNTGERKVHDMVRFGADVFRQGIEDLLDYGEQQARNVIAPHSRRRIFLRRLRRRGRVGRRSLRIALTLTINGDEPDPRFLRQRPAAHSSLNIPTGGDERHILLMVRLIYCLYARSVDPAERRHDAAGALHPARRHGGQPAISRRRRHAQPDLQAPAGSRSAPSRRRCPTCCRRPGRRQRHHERQDDRQPHRPHVMASIDPITGGGGGSSGRDGTDGSGANSASSRTRRSRSTRPRCRSRSCATAWCPIPAAPAAIAAALGTRSSSRSSRPTPW